MRAPLHSVFPVSFGSISFLLFAITGCGGGSKETRVAYTETKSSAEIVMQEHRRFTDRGWNTIIADSVIVHRFLNPVEFPAACDPAEKKQELSLDPDAERVAYRCNVSAPWHIYFLQKSGSKAFELCATPAHLDWASVPSFEKARVSFLECESIQNNIFANTFKEIVAESRSRGGSASVADFLRDTISTSFASVFDPSGDDWDRAFRDLPASERAKLQPFLKKTLEAPYNPYAVHRVVASMELSDDLDDLMVRAGEQMIASRPSGTEDPLITGMRAQTFDVVVRQLGRTNPAAAARIACKDAEAFSRNGISIVIPRAQLAAIARQKIPCDIGGVLDRSKCDGGFACCYRGFTCGDSVRHACTAAELSELVKMELAQDPKKPWPSGGGFGYELLVAVAMNQNSESARQFLERVKKVPVCDAPDSKKP